VVRDSASRAVLQDLICLIRRLVRGPCRLECDEADFLSTGKFRVGHIRDIRRIGAYELNIRGSGLLTC